MVHLLADNMYLHVASSYFHVQYALYVICNLQDHLNKILMCTGSNNLHPILLKAIAGPLLPNQVACQHYMMWEEFLVEQLEGGYL